MKLTPWNSEELPENINEDRPISNGALSVLEDVGLVESVDNAKLTDKAKAKALFTKHGAGIEDIAKLTGTMIRAGEESTRLKACDIALRVHEILKEVNDDKMPQITINIVGSNNKTLVNLVLPN